MAKEQHATLVIRVDGEAVSLVVPLTANLPISGKEKYVFTVDLPSDTLKGLLPKEKELPERERLLQACKQSPWEPFLIYCDWLDEYGDEKDRELAFGLRWLCESRRWPADAEPPLFSKGSFTWAKLHVVLPVTQPKARHVLPKNVAERMGFIHDSTVAWPSLWQAFEAAARAVWEERNSLEESSSVGTGYEGG